MKFFLKMERKYGKYAINDICSYISLLGIAGIILSLFSDRIFSHIAANYGLSPINVLRGQIWRLFTYHLHLSSDDFTKNAFQIINLIFLIYIGRYIQRLQGKFRLNIFILLNVILYFIAGIIVAFFNAYSYIQYYFIPNNEHLFMALMILYAFLDKESVVNLYFIFPMKIRYIVLFYYMINIVFFIGDNFVIDLIAFIICIFLPHFISIILYQLMFYNKLSFFGNNKRKINRTKVVDINKSENNEKLKKEGTKKYIHKCHVCGRTELDNPELEFRYCSKCDGEYEYCSDHLYTHIHVKK